MIIIRISIRKGDGPAALVGAREWAVPLCGSASGKGKRMALEEEGIVREWLDHLEGLDVKVKKMFGCWCLYCDGQAVGWLHDSVLSLRETGLDYIPADIRRPGKEDRIQEMVIPFDHVGAEWLPRAVRDTADARKGKG